MNKKKYKISEDELMKNDISIGKLIFYFGLLSLLCVMSFLVAKYIVSIDVGERPIDTSERR